MFVFLLVASALILPMVLAEDVQLTVKTEKSSYTFNETLNISGKADPNAVLPLPVKVMSLEFLDVNGNPINQIKTNVKVFLSTSLKNTVLEDQKLTYIAQVKDSGGKVVYIGFIGGTIPLNKTFTFGVLWEPKNPGEYTVEIYVWRSLKTPEPLSHVFTLALTVLEATATEQSKIVYGKIKTEPKPVVSIQLFDPKGKRKAVAQAVVLADGSYKADNIYTFSQDDPLGTWILKVYQAGLTEEVSFKLEKPVEKPPEKPPEKPVEKPPEKISTTLTISVSPEKVDLGSFVKVSGMISPPVANVPVILTYKKAGEVKLTKTVFSGSDGSFTDEFKPDAGGKWTVQASWEGSEKYKGAKSLEVEFEVISKGCLIATATYGSELAEEVQFLRGFRERVAYATFAGTSFMEVFHAWYYSFSPYIAETIRTYEPLKSLMKIVLYPLLGILHLATVTYNVFGFNNEMGIVIAGLVASSLIGLVYFTPLTTLTLLVFKRVFKKPIPKTGKLKFLAVCWLIVLGLIVLAEVLASPLLMKVSTGSFVVLTVALTTGVLALKVLSLQINPKSS